MCFLSIDIGATNTLIGYGDQEFDFIEKTKTEQFLNEIENFIENKLTDEQLDNLEEVAVAVAGPMDREKGVFYPPNIEIDQVDIITPLEGFGDVKIVNDCTSAVLGEYTYGDHSTENLVYITISSGIGAGVIIDGNVLEGWNGNFGEVGHMEIGDRGLKCGCGEEDHWEAYCSGNSIPKLAEEVAGEEYGNALELFEEYYSGDEKAERAIDEINRYNAKAVTNIVNLYNPEKIVIGGAVALNHPEEVVQPLQNLIKDRTINEEPEIELCALGEHSVLHGLRASCRR